MLQVSGSCRPFWALTQECLICILGVLRIKSQLKEQYAEVHTQSMLHALQYIYHFDNIKFLNENH